jgi:hypothetical protein
VAQVVADEAVAVQADVVAAPALHVRRDGALDAAQAEQVAQAFAMRAHSGHQPLPIVAGMGEARHGDGPRSLRRAGR